MMKVKLHSVYKDFYLVQRQKLSVLTNLNMVIEKGSFIVILGASGCGKSTLLSMIAGLTMPTSGTIIAGGQEVTGPSPSRTLLFQQPSLLPWLTVQENIAFGCQIRGEKHNLQERVRDFIEVIGLTGFEDSHPPELSVGMAQRVSLARALIGQPELLLLDEPFGALDTLNRTRLQDELIQIWHDRELTTIFVTHDIDEALTVGEKIVFLGGTPCTIQSVYDVNLPYPREIASNSFFQLRQQIIADLQELIKNDHLY